MYIPKYFKVTNVDEIWEFVQKTLWNNRHNQKRETNRNSFTFGLTKQGDDYFITGHMAYGNPQWRTFETCEDVLVMFQGPHSYISSSWYENEEVPTWNYQAVHIYGKASILDKEELIDELTTMLKNMKSIVKIQYYGINFPPLS